MNKKIFWIMIVALSVYLAGAQEAVSKPVFLKAFEKTYPEASGSRIDACVLCHMENSNAGSNARNQYGNDFKNAEEFTAIESQDSDGDGINNIVEIKNLAFPGDANDHPAVTAQTTGAPADAKTSEKTAGFEIALVLIALLAIYPVRKKM